MARIRSTFVPSASRRAVAERYGAKRGDVRYPAECFYCGAPGRINWFERPGGWVHFEDLALDHFFPFSGGGTGDGENLVLACRRCNSSKGAKAPAFWLCRVGI